MRAAALLCALCLLPLPRAPAGPLPPGAAGTRAPPWTRAQVRPRAPPAGAGVTSYARGSFEDRCSHRAATSGRPGGLRVPRAICALVASSGSGDRGPRGAPGSWAVCRSSVCLSVPCARALLKRQNEAQSTSSAARTGLTLRSSRARCCTDAGLLPHFSEPQHSDLEAGDRVGCPRALAQKLERVSSSMNSSC